jgi:Ca2+-binding EF-hand superfamily protein
MISSISGSSSLTQSYMAQMRQQMFNKIDTDGDGKHSKEEISAMVANGPQGGPSVDEIFSKADTDGDGYISQSEFEAVQGGNGMQGGASMQGNDSVDALVKKLFNALENEEQVTSSATSTKNTSSSVTNMAQMLSDALKSYIQSSTGSFSQGNFAQNLLGSDLYA